MSATALKEKLLYSKNQAAEQIAAIKALPELNQKALFFHLRNYLKSRFLLEEEDCRSENLQELAAISLAKTLAVSPAELKGLDLSQTCTGSSSVFSKKVLLLMALERELNISIPEQESVRIKTITDLTTALLTKLR